MKKMSQFNKLLIITSSIFLASCSTMSSCNNAGRVEDADLFSIGYMDCYKQEQARLDNKVIEEIEEIEDIKSRLQKRKKYRDKLRKEESKLKNKLREQRNRIRQLIDTIQIAHNEKRITDNQRIVLQDKLEDMYSEINSTIMITNYSPSEKEKINKDYSKREDHLRRMKKIIKKGVELPEI